MTTKIYKIRIKKGDTVIVRSGKYKGKTGKVEKVHPKENKLTVNGINMAKKHLKPNRLYPQGAIIDITRPIFVGKVGLVDPDSNKATRIVYKFNKSSEKVRHYKSSGKEIK
jgi:large subunit ribosomal protein L24